MVQIVKLQMLQDELSKLLSEDNLEYDEVCVERAMQVLGDFVNSEPSFNMPKKDNTCISCEFWDSLPREGICTQKVKTITGNLENLKTMEHYGCTTWEKKEK